MLKGTRVGDVTEIKMGRSLDGSTVLYWVAAYLIGGVLIDTGCDYTKKELADFLSDKKVSCIINTHHHEDHVGANALLKERRGVRAFAHQEAIHLMSEKYELYPFQRETWGYPTTCTAEPIGASFSEGGVSLRVIETPGHCKGHISLFEENRRALFSGDIWVGERPKTARTEENENQLITDLGKFEKLRPNVMFASLGKVVPNPTEVIKRTRLYLEETRDRILGLHSAGKSSEQIRDELFGRESVLAPATQYQLSTKIFIESFLRNPRVS
jgi:glyoxylase-like metal-dependent hydrolase (beta-lactamase superfamily II)